MGFRTYKATVTYQSSVLAARQLLETKVFTVRSLQPIKDVNDLAFLHALSALPANSTITAVEVHEEQQAVAA